MNERIEVLRYSSSAHSLSFGWVGFENTQCAVMFCEPVSGIAYTIELT